VAQTQFGEAVHAALKVLRDDQIQNATRWQREHYIPQEIHPFIFVVRCNFEQARKCDRVLLNPIRTGVQYGKQYIQFHTGLEHIKLVSN